MKTCGRCGFHNMDLETRCVRCGMWLDEIGRVDPLAPVDRPRMDFQPGRLARRPGEWLVRLGAWGRLKAYRLVQALSSELPREVLERKPWKAGLLSLAPGAGQLYNHQPKKAALFAAVMVIWGAVAVATLWQPWSDWVLLGYVGLMLWAFQDGVLTALAINGRPVEWWAHRVAYFLAWVFYAFLLSLTAGYLGSQFFAVQIHKMYGDALAPVLRDGETVLMNRLSYWLGEPRVGQVAMYRPHRMHIRLSGSSFEAVDTWIDQPMVVGRIVAGPGQVVERRGGTLYVDGQPMAAAFLPKRQNFPGQFRIQAGEDEYIILINQADNFLRPPGIHGKIEDFWAGIGQAEVASKPSWELRWELYNWEEVCRVPRKQLVGRISVVVEPPISRRIVR